jgi:molecular chaperone Hsp33
MGRMSFSLLDQALGFTIASRHARGRVARLGPALDTILSAHSYPPAIERVLAEALVLAALFGSTLKDADSQLTLQAQTQGGAIDLLVCDFRGGEMRGYVRHDADRLAELPVEPSLFALFGQGYLAITFDQAATGERYQGIVPLEGGSLAEAAESYFAQSEQIPSLVRIGVTRRRTARMSPAACCCSICPRARKAATGSTRGSIIPNGSMSRRWARPCGTTS